MKPQEQLELISQSRKKYTQSDTFDSFLIGAMTTFISDEELKQCIATAERCMQIYYKGEL